MKKSMKDLLHVRLENLRFFGQSFWFKIDKRVVPNKAMWAGFSSSD